MTRYTATIVHNSISRARIVPVGDTPHGMLIAQRRVGERNWTTWH